MKSGHPLSVSEGLIYLRLPKDFNKCKNMNNT